MIPLLSISKILCLLLAFVAAEAGLCLKALKIVFFYDGAHLLIIVMT